jgi:predicted PurR-regulated permease PerM
MANEVKRAPGQRALLTAACAVVVIAGLRELASVLLPICAAVFLALISLPPIRSLQRRGFPDLIAVLVVFSGVFLAIAGLSFLVGASISDFEANLPIYQAKLRAIALPLIGQKGVQSMFTLEWLPEKFETTDVLDVVGAGLGALGTVFSQTVLVLLIVVFMLTEAAGFPAKLRMSMGDPRADLARFAEMADRIQGYFVIKTRLALGAGLAVAGLAWATHVDFALLWGVAAFALSFVPFLGPVVASVPPILFALLESGWGVAGLVAGGCFAIHAVVGNILEPKLMGDRLGLSAMVAFVSLLFWGWLWGTPGMLFAVPLTMIVKIGLEMSDDLRWFAVILGPNPRMPGESRWTMRASIPRGHARMHRRGVEESRAHMQSRLFDKSIESVDEEVTERSSPTQRP